MNKEIIEKVLKGFIPYKIKRKIKTKNAGIIKDNEIVYYENQVIESIEKALSFKEEEIKKKIDERIKQLKKKKDATGKKKVGDVVYLHIYGMINELKELKNSLGEEKKK